MKAAAAAAGMSERTARAWKKGPLPSQTKKVRWWRTRSDPFEGAWASDVEPMLRSDERGVLEAKTILEQLVAKYPAQFDESHLRTLQRRIRHWRCLYGPAREVRFEQVHPPGREAQFDFTDCTALGVTILGELLAHLWFELVLMFSGWRYAALAFGETFEAMVSCIQGALSELGGVPEVLRHDNLSAATQELRCSGGRTLTKRYADVLDHYGLRSTRIEPGESHQNGGAEKAHDLFKKALDQALVLRGSRDFDSIDAYVAFVQEHVIAKRNARAGAGLEEERRHLRPLPASRLPEYTPHSPRVTSWSTITVAHRIYSVPSRLIGHEIEARLHADVVEVRLGQDVIETMPRLRGDRHHRIDYRHVIWSLVQKPGAFARYKYRDDLFPSLVFRRAYDRLCELRGERADVEYVRVLHLAASTLESRVEQTLDELLARGERFDYAKVRELASPPPSETPVVRIGSPDIASYDDLLRGAGASA